MSGGRVTGALCSYCGGSGETMKSTSHLGPDDYDFPCSCDACNGTGSGDLAEVIKSLGYWEHKTDIKRTLVERSAVLRVIEKFAQSRQPSAQGGEMVEAAALLEAGRAAGIGAALEALHARLQYPTEACAIVRALYATPPATSGMKEAALQNLADLNHELGLEPIAGVSPRQVTDAEVDAALVAYNDPFVQSVPCMRRVLEGFAAACAVQKGES